MNEFRDERDERLAPEQPRAGGGEHAPAPQAAPPAAAVTIPGTLTLINRGIDAIRTKREPLTISLLVSAVATIPFFGATFLFEQAANPMHVAPGVWVAFGLAFLWMLVISVLNNGAVVYLFAHPETAHTYQGALRWAFRNLWAIAWIGILSTLILMAAALAFVVPALILSVYLAFSMLTLAREGRTGMAALIRSTDLVHGAFWAVLGRFVLMLIMVMLVNFVFGFIGVVGEATGFVGGVLSQVILFLVHTVASWLFIAVIAQVMEYRRVAKPSFDVEAHKNLLWTYRIASILGIFVPILLGAALFVFALQIMSLQSGLGGELDASTWQLEPYESEGEALTPEEQAQIEEFMRQFELNQGESVQ